MNGQINKQYANSSRANIAEADTNKNNEML